VQPHPEWLAKCIPPPSRHPPMLSRVPSYIPSTWAELRFGVQDCGECRKAEEANATRGEPLGLDRRHNRYWRLVDPLDCSGDPLAGCLVVECSVQGSFRYVRPSLLRVCSCCPPSSFSHPASASSERWMIGQWVGI